MKFADPHWLWLLALLVPLTLARLWWALEGRDAIAGLVSPGLRDRLVVGGSALVRNLRFALLCVALAGSAFTLARPQWGEITREVQGEGRNVIIAIDTSRSMLAEDLKPNRLTRAKLAAQDLVDALPEDLIGLMAFAGSAFVQVPITTDRAALTDALEQLDTYAISRGGTNLASAVQLAAKGFEQTTARNHALIMFTDGENLEGDTLDEVRKAAKRGTIIITVGVGSAEGALIPDPDSRRPGGGFVRDDDGEVVRSRLDSAELEKIARTGNGIFLHLDAGAMNSEIIRKTLSTLDTSETEGASETVPIERYRWPLALALLALALAMLMRLLGRPHGPPSSAAPASAVLLLLLATAPVSPAKSAGEAARAYRAGEYERAIENYQRAIDDARPGNRRQRLQLGLGSAAYRSGDHELAMEAFAQALLSDDEAIQQQAHYNFANNLFRTGEKTLGAARAAAAPAEQGSAAPPAQAAPPDPAAVGRVLRDWRGAEEHYASTLDLAPDHADALHNLEVVRRRIEELEQQLEQQQEQQEQQEQEQEQEQEQNEDQPPEEGESGENPDQPQQPEQGEGSDDTKAEPREGEPPSGEQQPDGEGDQGENRERQEAQAADEIPMAEPTGEEPVDPETGYSVEQARRQLEALSDEQLDIQPLRRRVRSNFFKDW